MLQLKNLPDAKILEKFVARYPDAEVESVLPFLNLLRAGADLSDALDALLAQHGLLQGRWWVLILLMREDDLISTPSDLAEKAGVSRATMTGLIDGLERDGLVQRLSDDSDRRKLTIRLTALGQAKLDDVMPSYYQKVKQLMRVLTQSQREDLVAHLKLLTANIEALR
ncbi:MAG TPA: MarR family transcriptional regulator [Methylophilaceae bacterium]|nr:MarR family transcriptional regulator [Methylophilaceae bacterium]HQR60853.1 MarR family transcriptional regulator [Methylophilaceae bacterium]